MWYTNASTGHKKQPENPAAEITSFVIEINALRVADDATIYDDDPKIKPNGAKTKLPPLICHCCSTYYTFE